MADEPAPPAPYDIKYSEDGKRSRKELPLDALPVLLDIIDALCTDPDAYPQRTTKIGSVRIYKHPRPALEVTFEVDVARRVLSFWHFVVPKVQVTKPVFISYSHKDSQWLAKLRQFLRPLEDQDLIRVWADTEIRAGSEWLQDIRSALQSARVAVFLVTQNFLDSPFIREQELPVLLQAAHDRGCLIFWIAVSSTTFEDSPLAKIQSANPMDTPLDLLEEPQQNEVLRDIYKKLRAAVTID